MRKLLLFLLLFFAWSVVLAQPTRKNIIRGVVVDSASREPLLQASVALFSAKDSAFQAVTVTGGEGDFYFQGLKEGSYRVLITFVGYRNITHVVTIGPSTPQVDLGTLDMVIIPVTLKEIAISQEKAPIEIKGDTLAFNAGSFKTRPHALAEDLLKKLPGVEISRDGTIRVQGEEVQRVLVDGKPFFGNDPKLATRNLPADILDKVQLYDQQSEQAAFSGFDDGNRNKAINLITKKDKRKGIFGQNLLGGGTQDRYQGRLSLNRFNHEQQLSVLAMGNNTNEQGFTVPDLFNFNAGSSNEPVNNSGGGMRGGNAGGGGGLTLASPGQGGGNQGTNPTGEMPTNITSVGAGGVNFRDAWGKKTDVSGSYFLSYADIKTKQGTFRQNILPSNSFLQESRVAAGTQQLSHRLNLQLDYQLDSLNAIRLIPNFTFQHADYSASSTGRTFTGNGVGLNQSQRNNNLTGDGVYGTNTFLYMRKFPRRGRTFSFNLSSVFNDQQTLGINRAVNEFYETRTNAPVVQQINQQNQQQVNRQSHTLTFSYTEPLSLRRSLEAHYVYGTEQSNSQRTVSDFNEQTDQYDLVNLPLSNNFSNAFAFQRAGLNLQTRRLKYTYTLGLDVQAAGLKTHNQSSDLQINRQYQHLLPSALVTYNFSNSRTLRINYRTLINPPTVLQLQPNADNTNPLHIRLGNPNLQPEYLHRVSAVYNAYNPINFGNLLAMLNLSRTENGIVQAVTFEPNGAQVSQPVNTNGNYAARGFVAIGRPIRSIKSNLNLNSNLSYARGEGFINNLSNHSQTLTLGQGLSLNSNWSEQLEIGVSANLNYRQARYSLQPSQNTSFFFKTLGTDFFYQIPSFLKISGDFTFTANSRRSAGFNQNIALLNLGLAQSFFRNKQGELKFSVHDLFNQNQSIRRNVGETYLEDVQYRVLKRYLMLSFIYHLRQFGGRKVAGETR